MEPCKKCGGSLYVKRLENGRILACTKCGQTVGRIKPLPIHKRREFRINEKIVLKLEEGKTNIYIEGRRFRQCKYLFILGPLIESEELNSIDEIAENLDSSLEESITLQDVGLRPSEEFWGHCSNLQAWVEHDYDTRLIHSSLAFPLLKKLAELGDNKALFTLQEEVAKRFSSGFRSTVNFLYKEKFHKFLTKEQKKAINFKDIKIPLRDFIKRKK